MLTGATPKEDVRSIMSRMSEYNPNNRGGEKEIKLCYVTVSRSHRDCHANASR